LKTICKCSLCRLGLSEVVYDLGVRVSLFDIIVVKVDNCISISMRLSSDTVRENYLFFAVNKGPLNFTIITYDLLLNSSVIMISCAVILRWKLHLIIFFFITIFSLSWFLNIFRIVLVNILILMIFHNNFWVLNINCMFLTIQLIDDFLFLVFKFFDWCLSCCESLSLLLGWYFLERGYWSLLTTWWRCPSKHSRTYTSEWLIDRLRLILACCPFILFYELLFSHFS